MLRNKRDQASSNIQKPSRAIPATDTDISITAKQEKSHQQAPKNVEIEQHTRSRSLSSLQSMFTHRKRPLLNRSTSQLSTHSTTTALSSYTSSSSSSIISSTSSKKSTFRKMLRLFPLMGSTNKSTLPLANTAALLSQKSLEFEALLEEYPSRTIKTSLTPCTAA